MYILAEIAHFERASKFDAQVRRTSWT